MKFRRKKINIKVNYVRIHSGSLIEQVLKLVEIKTNFIIVNTEPAYGCEVPYF